LATTKPPRTEEISAVRHQGHVRSEKLDRGQSARHATHYVQNILPSGLKAQVVAYSRKPPFATTARFLASRDELVKEAEALDAQDKALDDETLAQEAK